MSHTTHASAPAVLVGTNIGFRFPDGSVLFEQLNFSLQGQKCGLIGRNGTGKSTLMKIAAGLVSPSSGTLRREGKLLYLPQDLGAAPSGTVATELGVAKILRALQLLAKGNAEPELFEAIGDDWSVEERCHQALERVGLPLGDLLTPLSTLSPGQRMRIRLARILIEEPDLVLLDEPTNHLDSEARKWVENALAAHKGSQLVISHDRSLLRTFTETWELTAKGLRIYGGGYDLYEEVRSTEEAAALDELQYARKALDARASQSREAKQRQTKRMDRGQKDADRGGMPKILLGRRKRAAQQTLARESDRHAKRISDARERLNEARESLEDDSKVLIDTLTQDSPESMTLVEARDFNFRWPTSPNWFWKEDVSFVLRGTSRLAITGANGSGKTSLIELITRASRSTNTGGDSLQRGLLSVRPDSLARLDQTHAFLDTGTSLLEVFRDRTAHLTEDERRIRLARYLFRGDRVHQPCRQLSGGEKMRASLACVLNRNPAPRLLILDEPTNDLDLHALKQLEAALSEVDCALLVVAHDEDFLAAIGVDDRLQLEPALDIDAGESSMLK